MSEHRAGKLASAWIHCTDADVLLPDDYFRTPGTGAVAALHPFRHDPGKGSQQAHAALYDLWLRLHVLGLHWAGSPYAFHTIGSTIAVDAYSYAAVRGFPRRAAAEDFYLLNKLAKLGPIVPAPGKPLRILARVSHRVPFGTGRAMEKTGMRDATHRLLRSSTREERRRRAVHGWFDAFRTMKLIHHLRDHGVESVDLFTAAAAAGFLVRQSADAVADDVRVAGHLLEDLSWARGHGLGQ